jgi:hypothetical protein
MHLNVYCTYFTVDTTPSYSTRAGVGPVTVNACAVIQTGIWLTLVCIFVHEIKNHFSHIYNWIERLVQKSLQHFQFCRLGLFLWIMYFTILLSHPGYLCRVAAVKSIPVHLINAVIFSILEDRSARHYCCVYILHGILSFLFLAFFSLGGSNIPTWTLLNNHP